MKLSASKEVEELKNLFIVLVPLLLIACGGIDKEKLQQQVGMLVVEKISSDLNIKDDPPEITLVKALLTKLAEHQYVGSVTMAYADKTFEVPVTVTADKDSIQWQPDGVSWLRLFGQITFAWSAKHPNQ
jgi:hypothetical protein